MGELDPGVQRIIDQLPGALADVQGVEAELEPVSSRLRAIDGDKTQLDVEQAAMTSAIDMDHAQKAFRSYDQRLRDIMRTVLSDEDGVMVVPPLEDCMRIAEVDEHIVAAAGQPVVVLRPGKNWIDVAKLHDPDHSSFGQVGLQFSHRFRSGKDSIELPVHDTIAIDIATGTEPDFDTRHKDEELKQRDSTRLGVQPERIRPSINPLATRVLPAAEAGEAESDITYVLVGYDYLQQTLNRVLGFDFEEFKDNENLEGYKRFNAINTMQKRLQEVGINFDPDFINGYLAYRMNELEQSMRASEEQPLSSSAYQHLALENMRRKLTSLQEAGLL